MNKRIIKNIIFLCVILLFVDINFNLVNAQLIKASHPSNLLLSERLEVPNILIFVSPQYSNDFEIKTAINGYISAVKVDICWNTRIVEITDENNDYEKIDQIIENYYNCYNIKACIMVGEDIDTALAGDCNYMEQPSTIPWSTIGGNAIYERSEQGIICKPYKMDICISLIYPAHEQDYKTKKQQIISSFTKFSNDRAIKFSDDILVFESSSINTNSKEIYKNLDKNTDLYYREDPTDTDIQKSLQTPYSLYFVHGHSNPSGTSLNVKEKSWFSAEYVDEIDSPFFGADGCYVAGWWSNQKDNNVLDPSIYGTWYGSKIFSNQNTRAMVLGLLSQTGYSYTVSFIENAVTELTNGKTLAESMIGDTYIGDSIVIGDPTFYFTI